ncbi:MAG: ABC-2 family transporter protein [bacterium]
MKRYFRIYKAIFRINIAYILAYRISFINNIISSLGWGVFQIVWITLLTNKAQTAFGWRQDEMIFLAMGYIVALGIFHFLFSRNFDAFSRIIDRGEFDSHLLKPLDTQFSISTMILSYANVVRSLVGIILIIWWAHIHHYPIGPLEVLNFALLIGVGVMTMYSIWFIFITLLIWYPNLNNMADFLYTLNGLARYPSDMIRMSGKIILYLFIPLALVVATPMRALLRKNVLPDELLLVGLCVLLFYISRMFWKHSLKSYTSAS